MRLVLFDIDGTLINSGGAGGRALSRAIESVCGIQDSLNSIRLDGKTDPIIVAEALDAGGVNSDQTCQVLDRVFDLYLSFLEQELEAQPNSYRIMPGVFELLGQLDQDDELALGLATGNIEKGARLKLQPGGLNRFFPVGGYGSDSEDRTQLISAAIHKAQAYFGVSGFSSVCVVGDTPRDVLHGREAGTHVLAVATGSYSYQELEGSGPAMTVERLGPTTQILDFLRGGG
jgi:phosphoglycolate phosphatase-like HAD superfamily hydrolase